MQKSTLESHTTGISDLNCPLDGIKIYLEAHYWVCLMSEVVSRAH